jgi:hypothetical protein
MIKQILIALPLAAGFLWAFSTQADSVRSECGFSNTALERPEATSSCTFSQLVCQGAELSTPGQCDLRSSGVGFSLQASTGSSINQLRIQTSGLATDNSELSIELDGTAHRAELGDLDANGWPEIYVYVSSAGSGSYGSVVAYAVNSGKSISPIYLPSLDQVPEALEGYMGHDEFALVENRLVRRFPVYIDGDTNSSASGGTRQIQYQLVAGEAGWILEVDRIVEY